MNKTKNKESQVLLFLNLYQSGHYVVSKSKKEDADFSLAIDKKYQNGYLLQCYDNGRINKFNISVLLSRKLNREYQNSLQILDMVLYLLQNTVILEKLVLRSFTADGKKLSNKYYSREWQNLKNK